jgi:hypothetical protein
MCVLYVQSNRLVAGCIFVQEVFICLHVSCEKSGGRRDCGCNFISVSGYYG